MATRKVPVTITHRVHGVQPPVFVAGTFSDPQWTAHEMDFTTGSDGEHVFTKDFEAELGSKIQYKFRVGHGDWWILNDDAPTVTDDAGNKNNFIEALAPQDADTVEQDETTEAYSQKPQDGDSAVQNETDKVHDQHEASQHGQQLQDLDSGVQNDAHEDHVKHDVNHHDQQLQDTNSVVQAETDEDDIQHDVNHHGQQLQDPDRIETETNEGDVQQVASDQGQKLQDADLIAQDDTHDADTHSDTSEQAQQVQPVPRVEALKQSEQAEHSGTSTPDYARTAAEVAESAALVDPATPEPEVSNEVAGEVGYRQMTSTPPAEAANTAAEVAETAKELDADEGVAPLEVASPAYKTLADVKDDIKDDSLDIAGFSNDPEPVPLFAHECAGIYEDDEVPGAADVAEPVESINGGLHNHTEEDFSDPTLEKFPSTKDEIITTVKKVESGLNVDQTSFEGGPPSPVVRSRNSSVADILGEPQPSDESPKSARGTRRLSAPRAESRGSLSLSERSLSVASLGSIAEGAEGEEAALHDVEEEDVEEGTENSKAVDIAPVAEQAETAEAAISAAKQAEGDISLTTVKPALRPVVTVPSPSVQPTNSLLSPLSDEDEAIALKNSKEKDSSAENGHTGYLTPERASTPKPEEPGSPREPAPNATAPIAELDIDTLPLTPEAESVETSQSNVLVPPSPSIVVSRAEDTPPEEEVPSVDLSGNENGSIDIEPQSNTQDEQVENSLTDIETPSTAAAETPQPEDGHEQTDIITPSNAEDDQVEDSPRDIEVPPKSEDSDIEEHTPQNLDVSKVEDTPVEDSSRDVGITSKIEDTRVEEDSPKDLGASSKSEDAQVEEDSPKDLGVSKSEDTQVEEEDSPEDLGVSKSEDTQVEEEDSPEDLGVFSQSEDTQVEDSPQNHEIPSKSEDTQVEEIAAPVVLSGSDDSPKDAEAPSKAAESQLEEHSPEDIETTLQEDAQVEEAPPAILPRDGDSSKDIEAPSTTANTQPEEDSPKDKDPSSGAHDTQLNKEIPPAVLSRSEDSPKDGPKHIETPSLTSEDTGMGSQTETAATASGVEASQSTALRKRPAPQSNPTDRAGTPGSITETGREAAKSGNWFSAFFRLLFVDWMGGFVNRVCGGGRKTLIAPGVALVAVGAALYLSSRETETRGE